MISPLQSLIFTLSAFVFLWASTSQAFVIAPSTFQRQIHHRLSSEPGGPNEPEPYVGSAAQENFQQTEQPHHDHHEEALPPQGDASSPAQHHDTEAPTGGTSSPAESAELRGLKIEIAELEKTLQRKRLEVEYISDQADDYSKTGYARKVAEMENMRRMRSKMNSSSRSSVVANILAQFLPVMDKLNELKAKYGEDPFGSQYGALPGALNTVFTSLGVTEFIVQPGEPVDETRMLVEAEEYSEEFAVKTVIRTTSGGIELDGNVIVPASCVASLGSQSKGSSATPETPEGTGDVPPDTAT